MRPPLPSCSLPTPLPLPAPLQEPARRSLQASPGQALVPAEARDTIFTSLKTLQAAPQGCESRNRSTLGNFHSLCF